jgi:hypothetical protein
MKKKRGHKVFHVKKSFKKEFKRQIRLAVIAAIGFIIAFAWRDAIYRSAQNLVKQFTEAANVVLTEIYTALFITLIGVILLSMTSKLLKER